MADTVIASTADAQMVDEPLWMQATGGDAAINYSSSDFRTLIDALFLAEGVLGTAAFTVTQRGAGANFSIDVASGMSVVTGDNAANQRKYLVVSNGTVNVATPAAPGSGTRVHRVIARVRDKQIIGSGTYDWTLELLEDTGTGTPAQPSSAITLALVSIAAGQASVLNANITDQRPLAQIYNSGGTVAVATLSAAAASVTFSGLPAYNHLQVHWNARGDTAATTANVSIRINGDSGSKYWTQVLQGTGSSPASFDSAALATSLQVGLMPAASAVASYFASGTFQIPHFGATGSFPAAFGSGICPISAGVGGVTIGQWGGHFRQTGAITSLTLLASAGSFVSGSQFVVVAYN